MAAEKLFRQCRLRHKNVTLVANLPDRPDLKPRASLRIKGDPRWWKVEDVSDHARPGAALDRGWHNNI